MEDGRKFFRDKQVTIVGLARSGFSCARLLAGIGARVRVTDRSDAPVHRELAERLRVGDIPVQLGGHTEDFIQGSALVVISPGVTDEALPVRWARRESVPVLSEIECAARLCPAQIIAVTGSTGKTTVTTLIGACINASGRRAFVCGNIGTPFSGEVGRMGEDDWVSLEVSSFQLEHCQLFKPRVAVVLNCTPNHLDRYPSMEEYSLAKQRIFMNQDAGDTLILNAHDLLVSGWGQQARARVVKFCADERRNENQAAVGAVCAAAGVSGETMERVFAGFRGIEHRQEFVRAVRGVRFINDSKATTLESTLWALKTLPGPVVLIAGGKHKGIDYSGIREAARGKVKSAVLIGQAKEMIRDALGESIPCLFAATLPEAVQSAFEQADEGQTVLLSPMCSSFDMFKDYEERGRVFKEAVRSLAAAYV